MAKHKVKTTKNYRKYFVLFAIFALGFSLSASYKLFSSGSGLLAPLFETASINKIVDTNEEVDAAFAARRAKNSGKSAAEQAEAARIARKNAREQNEEAQQVAVEEKKEIAAAAPAVPKTSESVTAIQPTTVVVADPATCLGWWNANDGKCYEIGAKIPNSDYQVCQDPTTGKIHNAKTCETATTSVEPTSTTITEPNSIPETTQNTLINLAEKKEMCADQPGTKYDDRTETCVRPPVINCTEGAVGKTAYRRCSNGKPTLTYCYSQAGFVDGVCQPDPVAAAAPEKVEFRPTQPNVNIPESITTNSSSTNSDDSKLKKSERCDSNPLNNYPSCGKCVDKATTKLTLPDGKTITVCANGNIDYTVAIEAASKDKNDSNRGKTCITNKTNFEFTHIQYHDCKEVCTIPPTIGYEDHGNTLAFCGGKDLTELMGNCQAQGGYWYSEGEGKCIIPNHPTNSQVTFTNQDNTATSPAQNSTNKRTCQYYDKWYISLINSDSCDKCTGTGRYLITDGSINPKTGDNQIYCVDK